MAILMKQISAKIISRTFVVVATITTLILPAPLSAQTSQSEYIGDATAGEKVFKKCKACHKLGEKAKNATGPVLNGIIGRAAGSFEGYKYGKSMNNAGKGGLIWNEENIFNYIANPKKYLREVLGNKKAKAKMKFKLKKEVDRKNVIAYLKRFSNPGQNKIQKDDMKAEVPKVISNTLTYQALDNQICIQNKFPKTLLFTAESKGGKRRVKMIAENAILCVTAEKGSRGTVGVFENEEELEGCSRLAKTGQTQTLIKYASFDNCEWGE